jgi:vacuolar-type H+-ATPase subunit F/Vma7
MSAPGRPKRESLARSDKVSPMSEVSSTVTYIGDAAEAAGFRLAGAYAAAPAMEDVPAVFAQALASSQVVIVSARCAAQIAPARLESALALARPLVLIAPATDEPPHPLDPATRVARQLGLDMQ